MNENSLTLNDYCEFIVDCLHKTAPIENSDTGYYSIRTPDIGRGRLILENANRVSKETFEKWTIRAVPRAGDLILAREAPVGNIGIVPENVKVCCGQRTVHLRPDSSKIDPEYLVYLMNGDEVQGKIKGYSQGSTVAHLNMEDIRALILPKLPPIHIQRRIADLLSTYDDLIENNTRRIHILEQMSQAIFQLWFGNINPKKLPEGWKYQTLQEVADVVDCLHTKKPRHTVDGVGMFLQLNNIGENGKLDLSEKFLLNQDDYKLWTSRIEAKEGDCVITNVGRVAAVAQIPTGVKAALGRNMTGVRPRLITPTFLLEFLLSPQMAKEVHNKKDGGVIMDALNVRGIVKLELPIPPDELMQKFEKVSRPIRRRIEILVIQNINLRQTRELLLPRLISGEIKIN